MGRQLREHTRGRLMAPRPAIVRSYFDEDVLGLAKVVADLRSDVTFPMTPGNS